ncbi:hypothetical protein GC163_11955 [bacterium]|nr:hypothetical protein [bacterium]
MHPDSEIPSSGWPVFATLRRRLRRVIWWSGLSACVVAVLGGSLLAGFCDWWLRIDDVGMRILLSIGLCGLGTFTLWRTLWRPLRFPLTDLVLAQQLDRRFPGLAHRLSSAAEFQRQAVDPRYGSPELQTVVIRQAQADLQQITPDDLIEARRISPLVLAALVLCVVAAAVLQAYPLEAATAVRRLAWPWGRISWPQSVVLRLLDADGQPLPWDPRDAVHVVRGDELSLEVENTRGDLPENLRLQQRPAGSQSPGAIEELPLYPRSSTATDTTTRATAPITLLAEHDALEFRVVGGDDQTMPWFRLVAVDPPRVSELAITVTPPAYTRQPVVTLPTGSAQVRGWLGSDVEFQGSADRPVEQVEQRVGQQPSQNVPVSADHQHWTSTLKIAQPGSVTLNFVLRDHRGFADTRPAALEIRGEVDAIPEMVLTEPTADVWVTPTATVPLAMQARDDLGLTQLRRSWELRRNDPNGENSAAAIQNDVLQELSASQPQQAAYGVDWALEPLQLQAGDRIVFRVEALDAYDLGEPHIGKSAPRTLLVVSADEKQRELTGRIADMVEELRAAQQEQARLQAETTQLQTQLSETGQLRASDHDRLSRLQADQRRLTAQLTNEGRGLAPRIAQLRAEFPANQLHDAEAEPQLEQLSQQLQELAESTFPQLDQELAQAQKQLEASQPVSESPQTPPTDASKEAAAAGRQKLAQAERLQEAVKQALTERLLQLSQWQTDRQLGETLRSLADRQSELNEKSAELGAQTLSRALPELTPQQRADLATLADEQRRIAQEVDEAQRDFAKLSQRLEADDPQRSEQAQELANQVEQDHLGQQLRQAADQLASNRLGEAGPVQQQSTETLRRLFDDWTSDRPDDTEQLVKQTRAAEQQAEALQDDLDQLQKRNEAARQSGPQAPSQEALSQDAQELRKRIDQLERQLERLKLRRGADAAQSMSQRLKAAQQALEAGDHESAAAELAAAAEEAEQLQEELTAQREQAEEQLAQEELERIAGALTSIKIRQDRVIEETTRLDTERQAKGKLSRGQLRSLQDLSAVERELQQLTLEAENKVEQAVVAKAALESVARNLDQAAQRLENRTVDAITLMLERDAAQRLSRILKAWEESQAAADDSEAEQPPSENSEEENDSQNAGPPGESLSIKLQLTLLRELQADCLARTEFFETQRQADGTFPAELLPLLADLTDEQAALIQLTERLVELYRQSQPVAPAANDQAPDDDASPVPPADKEKP